MADSPLLVARLALGFPYAALSATLRVPSDKMRHVRIALVASITLLVTTATAGLADTLLVPSDFATIQAGVDAAMDGDTVLVAPGTYSGAGNKNINPGTKEILLRSEAGAASTVIECGADGRALYVRGGQSEAMEFSGFTVRNGFATTGAGVLVDPGSLITIDSCVFEGCETPPASGSVASILGQGVLRNCLVTGSEATSSFEWHGGTLDRLQVVDNEAAAGKVRSDVGPCIIESCVFVNNGARLVVFASYPVAMRNTVVMNGGSSNLYWLDSSEAPEPIEECTLIGQNEISAQGGSATVLRRCIIGVDSFGGCSGLVYDWGVTELECCRYSPEEATGDGWLVENGPQVYADPEFCGDPVCQGGYQSGMLQLSDNSPCLAENSPCGEQIGAFELGCGISGTDGVSTTGSDITFLSRMPALDVLSFELPFRHADERVTVEIFSTTGRMLQSHRLEALGGTFRLDSLDGLRSGIYMLRVTTDDGVTFARKFVRVAG